MSKLILAKNDDFILQTPNGGVEVYATLEDLKRRVEIIEKTLDSFDLVIWFDDYINNQEGITKEDRAKEWGYNTWEEYVAAILKDEKCLGANRYVYTGETMNINGNTYYLWEGGQYTSENVTYMITSTVDFDTLYNLSLEADFDNENCPYVALLSDDNEVYRNNTNSYDWLIKVRRTI